MVHSDNGIFLSAKKRWAIKPWKDMEDPSTHSISERRDPQKFACWMDSNDMAFWKRQSQRNNKKWFLEELPLQSSGYDFPLLLHRAQVQSLVRKRRSHMLPSGAGATNKRQTANWSFKHTHTHSHTHTKWLL